MKMIIFKLSLSILTAISVCILSVSATKTEVSPKTPASPDNQINSQNEYYIVKESDGKIGVFYSDSTAPLYLLDGPYVRDLPEYDRKLLQQGIIAQNNAELLKILEDYDY